MSALTYTELLTDFTTDPNNPISLTNITSTDSGSKWEAITDWLGRLSLLKGIPFQYIVPDGRMLPPESIKYFHVDQNWLTALVDGAYSIGRTSADPSAPNLSDWLEVQLDSQLKTAVLNAAASYRANKLKQTPPTPLDSPTFTGFLLRSQALIDFKSMVIKGYDSSSTLLTTIRFEHLAPDVLLVIFIGTLETLTLQEPSEGMHYGFKESKVTYSSNTTNVPNASTKQLRNLLGIQESDDTYTLTGSDIFRPYSQSSGSSYQPSGAVINMSNLSTDMFTVLSNQNGANQNIPYAQDPSTSQLNSADFALQFSEGVSIVTYTFSKKTG